MLVVINGQLPVLVQTSGGRGDQQQQVGGGPDADSPTAGGEGARARTSWQLPPEFVRSLPALVRLSLARRRGGDDGGPGGGGGGGGGGEGGGLFVPNFIIDQAIGGMEGHGLGSEPPPPRGVGVLALSRLPAMLVVKDYDQDKKDDDDNSGGGGGSSSSSSSSSSSNNSGGGGDDSGGGGGGVSGSGKAEPSTPPPSLPPFLPLPKEEAESTMSDVTTTERQADDGSGHHQKGANGAQVSARQANFDLSSPLCPSKAVKFISLADLAVMGQELCSICQDDFEVGQVNPFL
jgi:hypothetical protein